MTEPRLANRLARAAISGVLRFPVPAAVALIAGIAVAEHLRVDGLREALAALAALFWSMAAAIALERDGVVRLWPALPGGAAAAIVLFAGSTDTLAAETGLFLIAGGVFALLWALTRPLDRVGGWAAARSDALAAALALGVAVLACIGLTGVVALFGLLSDSRDLADILAYVWALGLTTGAPLFWFARIGARGVVPPDAGTLYRGLVLWLLLPLSVAGFLVLYGFAISLAPDFRLPEGGTGRAVVLFLFTAAAALHASAGLAGGARLAAFQKWGPAVMIAPAVAALFAVAARIDAYGLTEPRIALAALAVATLVMAAGGYLFRPLHSLRWQAAGVALVATLLGFSATSLAIADQKAALERLEADGEGAVRTEEDARRLSFVAEYLFDRDALAHDEWRAARTRADAWFAQAAMGQSLQCHASFEHAAGDPIAIPGVQEMRPRMTLSTITGDAPDPSGLRITQRPDGVVTLTDAQDSRGVMDLESAIATAVEQCARREPMMLTPRAIPIADGRYGVFVLRDLRLERRSTDSPWGVLMLGGDLLRR